MPLTKHQPYSRLRMWLRGCKDSMRGLHLTVCGWKQWLMCRGQRTLGSCHSTEWCQGLARPGQGPSGDRGPSTLWPFCIGIMVLFFCHSIMSPVPQTWLYKQPTRSPFVGWVAVSCWVSTCQITPSCEVGHKTTVQTHRGPTGRNRTIDIHVKSTRRLL